MPIGERIEEGISPKAAGAVIDRLREKVRQLDDLAREISRAYDAELHRIYGYDFCRPLPDGADSKVALGGARARWADAIEAVLLDFPYIINEAHGRGSVPCSVCRGTGRNPVSDNVNWFACSACGGAQGAHTHVCSPKCREPGEHAGPEAPAPAGVCATCPLPAGHGGVCAATTTGPTSSEGRT